MSKKLPKKQSALLRLAIKDLISVEADPRYSVHMEFWHAPDGDVCRVCLAGAVMAQTLNTDADVEALPNGNTEDDDALVALDFIRRGRPDMLERFIDNPLFESFPVTAYKVDPTMFKMEMLNIAEWLETVGE